MKKIVIYSIIAATLLLVGCGTKKGTQDVNNPSMPHLSVEGPRVIGGAKSALAPIVVYKVRGDYAQLVPITLTPDGREVASYPAPSDLRMGDGYATPVKLNDGWWYDRRGVGANSAFIRLTYAEYAALAQPPSAAELMSLIVDRKPFVDIVRCDRGHFSDGVSEKSLNDYIAAGLPGAQR